MCSFITHDTFKNTKRCPLDVKGNGAMVCVYTTRYDSKISSIKYLCRLFLFCRCFLFLFVLHKLE